jgi:hypothetical protein
LCLCHELFVFLLIICVWMFLKHLVLFVDKFSHHIRIDCWKYPLSW